MSHTTESRMRSVGVVLLVLGVVFGCLSVAVSAVIDSEHAAIQTDLAVVNVEMKAIKTRVDNIEGRLFSMFMGITAAVASSMAGTVFSILTYRKGR